MRRRALLAVAVAALAAPAARAAMDMPGGDMGTAVAITYSSFDPAQADVVAGDTVRWNNSSAREHTVTADDGTFDSGRLTSHRGFAHTFTHAGTVQYHCTIHAFMRGTVTVHDILLDGAPAAVAPKSRVVLTGREAMGLGRVAVLDAQGHAVAQATPDAMGHFAASFVPASSGSYRASAGGHTSPAVTVIVRDRHLITAVAGRTVRVRLDPAVKGARIMLQERSREHFGWWPIGRRRTDKTGRVRFRLGGTAARRVRAVLVSGDGWTPLARGASVRVAKKSHRR